MLLDLGQLEKRGDMSLGDHKSVTRTQWIGVSNSKSRIVLINDSTVIWRALQLTKWAARHGISLYYIAIWGVLNDERSVAGLIDGFSNFFFTHDYERAPSDRYSSQHNSRVEPCFLQPPFSNKNLISEI